MICSGHQLEVDTADNNDGSLHGSSMRLRFAGRHTQIPQSIRNPLTGFGSALKGKLNNLQGYGLQFWIRKTVQDSVSIARVSVAQVKPDYPISKHHVLLHGSRGTA